jgi:hypothetical protein
MRLYEITTECQKLLDQIDLCEDDEERSNLQNEFNHFEMQGREKIIAIAGHIRNLQEESDAIRRAVSNMEKRARRTEAQQEFWKNYVFENAELLGLTFPIKSPLYTISTRKNPPKLEIVNQEALMFDYSKVKVIEQITLDNERIKSDLLSGKQLEGAKLTYKKSIIIK